MHVFLARVWRGGPDPPPRAPLPTNGVNLVCWARGCHSHPLALPLPPETTYGVAPREAIPTGKKTQLGRPLAKRYPRLAMRYPRARNHNCDGLSRSDTPGSRSDTPGHETADGAAPREAVRQLYGGHASREASYPIAGLSVKPGIRPRISR